MKRHAVFLAVTFVTSVCGAETYKFIHNGISGRPDYVTVVTSNTLPSGSTRYAQINPSSQQTGPINLTTGTVAYFNASTVAVTGLTASQFVKTNASKLLVSSALTNADIPNGNTNYAQISPSSQQSGFINVSSGTVAALNASSAKVTGLTASRLVTTDASKNLESTLIWDKSCSTGTAFPSSPVIGQCFIHNPVGRTIEYRYDGSDWQPIRSYGSMTMYVDAARGTDSLTKGTATFSGAFATLPFAVNTIPGSYSGHVSVILGTGTYPSETVIQGKVPTGSFSITISGTKTTLRTGSVVAAANGSGNGSDGFGTLRVSGTPFTAGQYTGLFLSITAGTGAGSTVPIYFNNASTFTIVGVWPGDVPDATSSYEVFTTTDTLIDGGGTGVGITVQGGQRNIQISQMGFRNLGYGLIFQQGSEASPSTLNISSCSLYGIDHRQASQSLFAQNLVFYWNTADWNMSDGSSFETGYYLMFSSAPTAGGSGILMSNSYGNLSQFAIFGKTGGYGVNAANNSKLNLTGYGDIHGSGVDNISASSGAVIANPCFCGQVRLRNAVEYGARAANSGYLQNASVFTYAANGSGTFTPVSVLAGSAD